MRRFFVPALVFVVTLVGSMVSPGPTAFALDETGCLKCHSNPDLTWINGDGMPVSLYVDRAVLETSAHQYIDCTQCHVPEVHELRSPLNKLSLASKCGVCHVYERNLHNESIHGQWLALGDMEVASCVDCHSTAGTPHSIQRVLRYESPAYRVNIAGTCGRCHGDEELMRSYGIVEKTYETYMRTFHGKAIELGGYDLRKLNTATCVNCHGVHDIKKTTDPTSPVANVENLAATCEECHPGAGENFAASFLGHREATPENFPAVYWVERFFTVLTASVVAGGVSLVTLAAVVRPVMRRRRNRRRDNDHDLDMQG